MATPYLLLPVHQWSSLMAIPRMLMIPTYGHSSLVVPYTSLLPIYCCSLTMVVLHLLMLFTCGRSSLVVPRPLLIPTHGCSLPITGPRPSLLPHCYSPPIATLLLLLLGHGCSRIFKVPLTPYCCYSLFLFPQMVFLPPSFLLQVVFGITSNKQKLTNKVSFIIIIFIFYLIIFEVFLILTSFFHFFVHTIQFILVSIL
jgi:hypothetical protein